MRYLLDTNACIALLNGSPPSLVDRVRRHTSSEFGLPAPVTYELYYGAFKSKYTNRTDKIQHTQAACPAAASTRLR